MNKIEKLIGNIKDGRTILGVGPMSWNCVDAIIDLANSKKIPTMMIASRRQVETKELGGGYVADTETLAKYVKDRDVGGYVLLARDHGGPWQGTDEFDLPHDEAMRRCKQSYLADIAAGFDIIHLDPSLKSRPLDEILKDIKELHEFCQQTAKALDRSDLVYEVGTEEHNGQITEFKNFRYFLDAIKQWNDGSIKFIVGNTGTYVKEIQNVGNFDENLATGLVAICNEYGFFLKEHNADYLPSLTMRRHPSLGIHSANIAPEFGVEETRELLYILKHNGLTKEYDEFIDLAYNSGKWKKWIKKENVNEPSIVEDKLYCATICGHYVFSSNEFSKLKDNINKKINLDPLLFNRIKKSIEKYLIYFGEK